MINRTEAGLALRLRLIGFALLPERSQYAPCRIVEPVRAHGNHGRDAVGSRHRCDSGSDIIRPVRRFPRPAGTRRDKFNQVAVAARSAESRRVSRNTGRNPARSNCISATSSITASTTWPLGASVPMPLLSPIRLSKITGSRSVPRPPATGRPLAAAELHGAPLTCATPPRTAGTPGSRRATSADPRDGAAAYPVICRHLPSKPSRPEQLILNHDLPLLPRACANA